MKTLTLAKLAIALSVGALFAQIALYGLSADAFIAALSYSLGVILMAGHLEHLRLRDASYVPTLKEQGTRIEAAALWVIAFGLGFLFPLLLGDQIGRCLTRASMGAAGLFTVNAALPAILNR